MKNCDFTQIVLHSVLSAHFQSEKKVWYLISKGWRVILIFKHYWKKYLFPNTYGSSGQSKCVII